MFPDVSLTRNNRVKGHVKLVHGTNFDINFDPICSVREWIFLQLCAERYGPCREMMKRMPGDRSAAAVGVPGVRSEERYYTDG
jgi:hypothetical protein